MGSITIREFNFPDDHPAVIRFWEQIEKGIHVGPSDAFDEIEKKIDRDPDLFLIAEVDGEFIGTVIGGFDGRRGFIYHLAVANRYRRQAIGSSLLQKVEERLRAKGCLRCYLFVTSDNPEAMRFYEKHHWAPMTESLPFVKDLVK